MTYGICPVCGSIPVLPEEFRMLHLAARPTMILNYLYAAEEKTVSAEELGKFLHISAATLSVHMSRIRHEFRLSEIRWHLISAGPRSYALVRSVYDKDSSAKREEAPHS